MGEVRDGKAKSEAALVGGAGSVPARPPAPLLLPRPPPEEEAGVPGAEGRPGKPCPTPGTTGQQVFFGSPVDSDTPGGSSPPCSYPSSSML